MNEAQQLKERLKTHVVLMDGAMGTYYNRLHPEEGEPEFANRNQPDFIEEIHSRYIEAGAQLIRTNTFAANEMLFSSPEEVRECIISAVGIARNAILQSERPVFLAASIGPVRATTEGMVEKAISGYRDICDCFLEQGVRIFVFETFADTDFVLRLAKYLRKKAMEQYQEEVFVLSQFSVNRMGYTKYGFRMQRLVKDLEQESLLDAFGFNCGTGITHMNQLLRQVNFTKECCLSVLPNAGYEQMKSGRKLISDNPAYYAEGMKRLLMQGVNLIGGCCGTTPEFTKALAALIKENPRAVAKQIDAGGNIDEWKKERKTSVFMEKLNRGERVYVVEIDSPFDQNADRFLEAACRLKDFHVDMVTVSDSPMARPRAESYAMGIYVANQAGIPVMPHVCCRDRNLIGLRSSILGGYINGIRDMLIITGDPVARDDRNMITGVFDMNSIKLMEYVQNMNQELFSKEPIAYGGALNYAGINVDAIAMRMKKKMEAGCSYFLTQPVFSDEDISRVRELKEKTGAKILVGIMPLVSLKNALFMKNELPGIDVPDEIVNRYRADMSRQEAESVAVEICVELGEKLADFADGFYFMTPFNRVGLVGTILEEIRKIS